MLFKNSISSLILSELSEMWNQRIKWTIAFLIPIVYLIGIKIFYSPGLNISTPKVFINNISELTNKNQIDILDLLKSNGILVNTKNKADVIIEIPKKFKFFSEYGTIEIIKINTPGIEEKAILEILNSVNQLEGLPPLYKKNNINVEKTNSGYLFTVLLPGLLLLTVIQMMLSSAPEKITEEIEKGTLELYMTTDIKKSAYVIYTFVFHQIITSIPVIIYLLVMSYMFNLRFDHSLILIFILYLVCSIFLFSLGFLIGVFVRKKDFVRFFTFPFVILFLIATPIFYSSTNLPDWLSSFSNLLPTSMTINQVREILTGSIKFDELLVVYSVNLLVSLILLLTGYRILKWHIE